MLTCTVGTGKTVVGIVHETSQQWGSHGSEFTLHAPMSDPSGLTLLSPHWAPGEISTC